MKKNTHLFTSFKFAYAQINRAIEGEFYFEAITIEERILINRLFEVFRTIGFSLPLQKTTLEDLIQFLREHQEKVADLVPGKPFSFLNSLEHFWSGRNTCFQQVVPLKSAERKMDILEFLAHARTTVDDGKRLSREITTWANAFQKANSIGLPRLRDSRCRLIHSLGLRTESRILHFLNHRVFGWPWS